MRMRLWTNASNYIQAPPQQLLLTQQCPAQFENPMCAKEFETFEHNGCMAFRDDVHPAGIVLALYRSLSPLKYPNKGELGL